MKLRRSLFNDCTCASDYASDFQLIAVVRTLLALMLPPPPLSSPPFLYLRPMLLKYAYQPIAALFLTIAIDIVLFLRGVLLP
jgi:hypothetical protein